MKTFLCILLVLGFTCLPEISYSNDADERAIIGYWVTVDDETGEYRSKVRIFRATNGKYYGRIKDILNPEPGRENPDCDNCTGRYSHYKTTDGKVIGITFLRALEYNPATKRYENGTIFDPEKGREYRCEVWLDENTLNVRGIHWTGISRTQYWQPLD